MNRFLESGAESRCDALRTSSVGPFGKRPLEGNRPLEEYRLLVVKSVGHTYANMRRRPPYLLELHEVGCQCGAADDKDLCIPPSSKSAASRAR